VERERQQKALTKHTMGFMFDPLAVEALLLMIVEDPHITVEA